MQMTNQNCFEDWNPTTNMKADIILGAFIPIYFTLEGPKEIQILFEEKQNPLFNILM